MRIPIQVRPVQRMHVRVMRMYNVMPFSQYKNIQGSEVSTLPLSDIANDPSIVFEEGNILGKNPLIVFDIEKPIPPIEMCDVYCNHQMCDVYCIDAKERIIHGHIYNNGTGQNGQNNTNIHKDGKIIHGHIYGDVATKYLE